MSLCIYRNINIFIIHISCHIRPHLHFKFDSSFEFRPQWNLEWTNVCINKFILLQMRSMGDTKLCKMCVSELLYVSFISYIQKTMSIFTIVVILFIPYFQKKPEVITPDRRITYNTRLSW